MNLPTIDFKQWMPKVFAMSEWWIKLNQPWIMLFAALAIVYGIANIIIWLLNKGNDEEKEYDYEEY